MLAWENGMWWFTFTMSLCIEPPSEEDPLSIAIHLGSGKDGEPLLPKIKKTTTLVSRKNILREYVKAVRGA
jgi:hypothetical protein